MSTETNKQIVRRFTEEVLNQGNMATLEEVCAADLLNHNPPPGLPGTREGLKMFVSGQRAAFPDMQVTVQDMIAEEDTHGNSGVRDRQYFASGW